MSSEIVDSPRSARVATLRAHIQADAENRPGIYRMLGPGGELLYIGKSIRIRTRLLSHLRAPRGEKAAEIIAQTDRIEWDYSPNEFAALIHELRQIRELRPLYNVEHKHDRQYSFIKVTNDAAPKLLVTGKISADGALYYGPFRGRARVSAAIRELGDLLELRDCAARIPIRFADQPDLFGHQPDPLCIRAELDRCLAPCAAGCTKSEYDAQVGLARRFLEGDADHPLIRLQERMQIAADRLDFEYAGALRDRAARLAEIRDDLTTLRGSIAGGTFLYPISGFGGDDRVYLIRQGLVAREFQTPTDAEGWRLLRELATREITHLGSGQLLQIQPHEAPEVILIARWFRRNPAEVEKLQPLGRDSARD